MKIFVYEKSIENRKQIRKDILNKLPLADVRESGVSENTRRIIANNNFDIIFIDIDTLNGDLLNIAAIAREKNPDVQIIVLTLFPIDLIKEKLYKHGILYYVDKVNQINRLTDVLDKIHATASRFIGNFPNSQVKEAFNV